MEQKSYRIGIDVGGTFTHAVAIDAKTQDWIASSKVPTTHHSETGVGRGVVDSLKQLMRDAAIEADQIKLVAHSTTQATNSLLEGDVQPVGIVAVGTKKEKSRLTRATRLGAFEIAEGKELETRFHYHCLDSSESEKNLIDYLNQLKNESIQSIVVVSAFSVEDPTPEIEMGAALEKNGFQVTTTHSIAKRYGLKIRTRTAVINASILPKMLEVANHTEKEVRNAGILAPMMIMRSDGGVMSIDEMRRKPILTLLSGPAAGIAAALRYLRVSQGIFLEVGGTSTDISVIKNGRAMTRSASIGGHPTFLKTLDCRTVGIGGGSLPRVNEHSDIIGVGPRSAHIADISYLSYEETIGSLKEGKIAPLPGDPSDYLVFESEEKRFSLTPTECANALGAVSKEDCAYATDAFRKWAHDSGREKGFLKILELCAKKVSGVIHALIADYELDETQVTLIGGGGGAYAIVPAAANGLHVSFEIADKNDVISAIGVALGLVRETVEQSIVSPTQEDLFRIRTLARQKVIEQGADPKNVEVFLEIDERANIVRAEAQGPIEFEMSSSHLSSEMIDFEKEAKKAVWGAKTTDATKRGQIVETAHFQVFSFDITYRKRFGIFPIKRQLAVALDQRGIVRLSVHNPHIKKTTVTNALPVLRDEVEKFTVYGDGGAAYPGVFVLVAEKVVDLSKLLDVSQCVNVLEMELKDVPQNEEIVFLFSLERAKKGD